MTGVSWIVLGSSSGIPSVERACAGHLLESNDRLLLFDCGSGVTSSFLRHGFNTERVDSIIISHTHADHIADLPFFIQFLYQQKRTADLTVYLPQEAIVPIKGYLDAAYLFQEKLPFPLHLKPMAEVESFFDGTVIVSPLLNSHLKRSDPLIQNSGYSNRMEAYSFLIKCENGADIFYSADIGSPEDIADYLDGLKLLVVESTHTSFSDLLRLLDTRRVENLLLVHTSDEILARSKSLTDQTLTDTKIMVAEDGFAFRL